MRHSPTINLYLSIKLCLDINFQFILGYTKSHVNMTLSFERDFKNAFQSGCNFFSRTKVNGTSCSCECSAEIDIFILRILDNFSILTMHHIILKMFSFLVTDHTRKLFYWQSSVFFLFSPYDIFRSWLLFISPRSFPSPHPSNLHLPPLCLKKTNMPLKNKDKNEQANRQKT